MALSVAEAPLPRKGKEMNRSSCSLLVLMLTTGDPRPLASIDLGAPHLAVHGGDGNAGQLVQAPERGCSGLLRRLAAPLPEGLDYSFSHFGG